MMLELLMLEFYYRVNKKCCQYKSF
jgi:hypothetical protein